MTALLNWRRRPSSAKPGRWLAESSRWKNQASLSPQMSAGEPIVVVRGNDGLLRGFFNVCRHHAAAVVTEPCGQASFCMSYHGWNYGPRWLTERNARIRGVKNFERQQNGLVPVKADTWEKIVFINLDPKAAPLKDFSRPRKTGSPLEVASCIISNLAPTAFTAIESLVITIWRWLHVPHLHKD